jgi:hypothetical protein
VELVRFPVADLGSLVPALDDAKTIAGLLLDFDARGRGA